MSRTVNIPPAVPLRADGAKAAGWWHDAGTAGSTIGGRRCLSSGPQARTLRSHLAHRGGRDRVSNPCQVLFLKKFSASCLRCNRISSTSSPVFNNFSRVRNTSIPSWSLVRLSLLLVEFIKSFQLYDQSVGKKILKVQISNKASFVFRKTVTLLLALIFVSLIQHATDTRIPLRVAQP